MSRADMWWKKMTRDESLPKRSDYRVTVVQIESSRKRFSEPCSGKRQSFYHSMMNLIFGTNACVTIYAMGGRLVGRSWAGRGLYSPQRVAERMIREDTEKLRKDANVRVLYNVKAAVRS